MALGPAEVKQLQELITLRLQRRRRVVTLGTVDLPSGLEYRAWLKQLGLRDVLTLDAWDGAGVDRVVDLNRPILPSLAGQADLLIDPGTLEHIFDLRRALENVVELLAPGGIAYHHTPLNWVDHGFVNPCPCFWVRGYEAQGFTVAVYFRRSWDLEAQPWPWDLEQTTILPADRYLGNVIAQAPAVKQPGFTIPRQERLVRKWEGGGK